ncbi:hypothetical protein K450DRAFT_237179 [Umbelopsis ramanniana AG]|uniref:Uncharacterized protein n=1 Tax=Umbelopsis ramanniana AG TaxID=1314678 RepID=A0AAD5ECH9_UMBRA|nr:uncharacterized protein K450DRAFT_237179 [Umbelopsis ramanniana AG]KAI8580466.1 hypothetical protein K450DRAFT_237179 [Umbelopsis ramanniana AG]
MIRTSLQRIYSTTARRAFSRSAAVSAESKQTPELAKKHADKIRKEEQSKEQRPSPIPKEAQKKFDEMNKRAEQKKK